MDLGKAMWLFQIGAFFEKIGSSTGPKILTSSATGPKILNFGSHSSANFYPILDFFIPNCKLENKDSQTEKTRSCKYSRFQLT